jgi:hypothetical protein
MRIRRLAGEGLGKMPWEIGAVQYNEPGIASMYVTATAPTGGQTYMASNLPLLPKLP